MKATDTKGWTMERRSARRFQLQIPLIVRWRRGSTVSEAFTDSEDVSSRGAYFLLPKDIEIGLFVEIVMVLPTVHARIRCLGRIQRTQPQAEHQVGVAVAIKPHQFLRDEGEAA
jgi:hypothetical protein